MRIDFYDQNGFMHDEADADSNNRWIYSGYNFLMNGELPFDGNEEDLLHYWFDCIPENDFDYYIYRQPHDSTPPLSRDEAIGMDILNMPIYAELKANDFYLCRKEIVNVYSWTASFIDLIKVGWERRKLKGSAKRNFIWENKRYAAMKISEKLLPHDVYYFQVSNGEKTSFAGLILFYLYALSTIIQRNYSARNVLWGQLANMGETFIRFTFSRKKNFDNYFVEGHPMRGDA